MKNKSLINKKNLIIIGIIFIITSIIYACFTLGNELFDMNGSEEKRKILMVVVYGIVLLIEGSILESKINNDQKFIILLIICFLSAITLPVNIILYGISQFFNFYGIMTLIFDVINIYILISFYKNKNIKITK